MDKSSEEYLEHIKKLEPRKWLPEDIKIAIESFIASTIMVEENDLDYVPNEYVINLLETIKKHKEYMHQAKQDSASREEIKEILADVKKKLSNK